MEPVKQTQKKYGSRAIWVAIIVGFCFFLAGYKPVGKGLVLGTIFSVINFVLIGQTLPLRIGKSKGKTFFLSLGSIFCRYILLAVPIFVAVKFEQFDLVGAILGLFMIQLVIMADHFFKLVASKRET
ncbi:MAG: ATP synthase subunit I [Deltaproteobacteria bacterium]|nr:ATP synthase subunit I [Deltaproteobacteria bacterium]